MGGSIAKRMNENEVGLIHGWLEGNVSFNDTLNKLYFMVMWHQPSGKGQLSERGSLLLPLHGILFPISTIPQTG